MEDRQRSELLTDRLDCCAVSHVLDAQASQLGLFSCEHVKDASQHLGTPLHAQSREHALYMGAVQDLQQMVHVQGIDSQG